MYTNIMAFQCMLFTESLTAKFAIESFFCIMHFSYMTIQSKLVSKLFPAMSTNHIFGFISMDHFKKSYSNIM